MSSILRLNVRHLEKGEQTKFDLHEPFALIGCDPACPVHLRDAAVLDRHIYLQILHGRVHFFDVGSRTGLQFRDGPRHEGILTGTDSLVVGPFQIRLSQAPSYRIYAAQDVGPGFENRALDDAHLMVRHTPSRSLNSGPLRERVTLIGRGSRCHIKLEDDSVPSTQFSVVRTQIGDWIVNLRPDEAAGWGTEIQCVPLLWDRETEIGPYTMRYVAGTAFNAAEPVEEDSSTQSVTHEPQEHEADENSMIPAAPRLRKTQTRQVPGPEVTSDEMLVGVIQRFGEMQQQMLSSSHERSMMLARMIAEMRQNQNLAIHEQIDRIQTVTTEMVSLRQGRGHGDSGPQPPVAEDTAGT